MADRKNTVILKRSNVAGKVPTAGDLLLGEIAINTADAMLYASGTTQNSILPIGWDRIARTGDTVTGDFYVNGFISATTISAATINATTVNVTSLASTGTSIVTATSGGTLSGGSQFIIPAFITSGGTAANLLETALNWDIDGIYTGTTITDTYQGQQHYSFPYYFMAVQDNVFIRLIRG
jgi:hypothetical protein